MTIASIMVHVDVAQQAEEQVRVARSLAATFDAALIGASALAVKPTFVAEGVIIEEMTSFLKVPNGEEIVIDYYERMRKYSAQVISVFSQ